MERDRFIDSGFAPAEMAGGQPVRVDRSRRRRRAGAEVEVLVSSDLPQQPSIQRSEIDALVYHAGDLIEQLLKPEDVSSDD